MLIQIAGITGTLGGAVSRAARARGYAVTATEDITRIEARGIVAPVVINCAGLVKHRQCPASAFMLTNAVGPHRLAEACDAVGSRLIHVSTDCVFHGTGPHCECDAPDATDVYARSKLAGEVGSPHLTIRTSFVGFGIRGLLAELMDDQVNQASTKQLWSGHTADALAGILIDLTERDDITGLLHIPGEFQSRWELCQALIRRFHLSATTARDDDYRADRRLISDRWEALGLPELPSFAAQLEAMHVP